MNKLVISEEIIKLTDEIKDLFIDLEDKKITEEFHKREVYTKLNSIKFLAENIPTAL